MLESARYAGLGGHRDLWRHRPPQGPQCAGASPDHAMGVCAAGEQGARAFTEPPWRLPTDNLPGLGPLCQPELEMPADFGGRPRGPGACDEGTARLGVARFGDCAWMALGSRGLC